jgi:hypothetical protein
MKFGLFNSNKDRELWIRLNAERQIEWEKGLTYFNRKSGEHLPTLQALHPRSMKEALQISRNQLEYDEKEKGKLRFTLEELLTLDMEGLKEIQHEEHLEWIRKFKKLGK